MLPKMKRVMSALVGSALLFLSISSIFAQDNGAAARAERMEIEDRYRRMNDSVRQLISANTAMQNRVSALAADMRKLQAEVQAEKSRESRNAAKYVTQEELKSLAKRIQEIDEKRQTDKKRIIDEIRGMLKSAGPAAASKMTTEEADKPAKKPQKPTISKKKKK